MKVSLFSRIDSKFLGYIFLIFIFYCISCGPKEKKDTDLTELTYIPSGILGLPDIPVPKNNPQSSDKVSLGAKLYSDKRFSLDGTVSCATCHKPEQAFVDKLKVSKGIKNLTGTRNAPTVLNAAYYRTQFWDGRRNDLEAQSKDPLLNPVEHGLSSHDDLIKIVRSDPDYTSKFKTVFGIDPDSIGIDHVAMAIASFERTIISGNSPFDRYRFGKEEKALSESAIRGLNLYMGKARCQDCHMIGETYAIFIDDKFHNLGVGFKRIQPKLEEILQKKSESKNNPTSDEEILTNIESSELGRFAVTGVSEDLGAFKTPGLRNIALTSPYMHDGSLTSLEQVIDLYDRGGESNPFLSSGIRPLRLSGQEKADLVSFLKSLTSPVLPNMPK
ncbi:cytochrome-c peroxidase [Leptospira dzoumogneensis]|uniref:Methylamine utilization protein MauG n=1 Tax=Leptospira dzoumogneensis TaxID=2484904 RepID=A0A4Z1A9H8_9LEPT|nr:cytochrome c peroxidase [Leptospira dzoumogneensis]TGM96141.1 cytochrome-c peroxidase [Leptospira dzoumogneensis]